MTSGPKLIDKLERRLAPGALSVVRAARTAAEAEGFRAFLVGGTVRDLVLDAEPLDVDVVIEGDATAVARIVAEVTGARLAKTTDFGTATVRAGADVIDLTTARAETYHHPGALPAITPSTIDDDLLRRDFTINAIALQLTGPATGRLLDPTGGEADLRAGLVRVLHDASFRDDATRIIRAVRYEARLGFRIEERTLDLMTRDLAYLDKISGTRIRQELARTFAEAHPGRAVSRMQELGVLEAIHPALTVRDEQTAALTRLRDTRAPPAAAWPLVCWDTPDGQLADVAGRLALTSAQREAVASLPEARRTAAALAVQMRPSEATHLLDALPLATVHALAAFSCSHIVLAYLRDWRTQRPALTGDDLIELGVRRGPDVGEVLGLLRAAKLDGEVETRADEVHIVDQFLARERLGLA